MSDNLLARDQAEALGLPRYFTGKPCRNGHVAERYVANNDCVACAPAKRQRVSEELREKRNAKRRAEYAASPKLREERSRANREWRARNPEKVEESAQKLRLRRETDPAWREEQNIKARGRAQRYVQVKHFYGLSAEQYDAMVKAQNHVCPICLKKDIRTLHIDHCHKTGKVRALICGRCNPGLGNFNDDPALLRRAAEYLEKYLAPE